MVSLAIRYLATVVVLAVCRPGFPSEKELALDGPEREW